MSKSTSARPKEAAGYILAEFDGDQLDDLERGLRAKYGIGAAGLRSLPPKVLRAAKADVRAWIIAQRAAAEAEPPRPAVKPAKRSAGPAPVLRDQTLAWQT